MNLNFTQRIVSLLSPTAKITSRHLEAWNQLILLCGSKSSGEQWSLGDLDTFFAASMEMKVVARTIMLASSELESMIQQQLTAHGVSDLPPLLSLMTPPPLTSPDTSSKR